MGELDLTSVESKATYEEDKEYVQKHTEFKVRVFLSDILSREKEVQDVKQEHGRKRR